MTLPTGLDEKPYYGSQLGSVDDDPAAGEYLQEEGGDAEDPVARRAMRRRLAAQSR
eukprot:CAMPEP_0205921654 /NCGR_PEP_ID=MMETSP1325-20131115/13208_1 /ASSEMBLY_ACC=CAM_ASM_000708 /TAXON_ID=236786 /ORGANISM="Florenciella sp., Strain RCC1007" /LENGTH=55 /DNA_ID=CAMNT_0053289525 /DNA_START=18 /DNA_END=182 /DNA_ORIENTATION=-